MNDLSNTIYATLLFGLCLMTFISICMVASSCANHDTAKAKPDPVNEAKGNCYMKRYSARPSCWSEGDWLVYCQRVQCKAPTK
jgi:hypothetical protein